MTKLLPRMVMMVTMKGWLSGSRSPLKSNRRTQMQFGPKKRTLELRTSPRQSMSSISGKSRDDLERTQNLPGGQASRRVYSHASSVGGELDRNLSLSPSVEKKARTYQESPVRSTERERVLARSPTGRERTLGRRGGRKLIAQEFSVAQEHAPAE